jgi:FtsP/CotA-like multicopper oxidase with cupredoxin domain
MKKLRPLLLTVAVLIVAAAMWSGYQGQADSVAVGNQSTAKSHDAARIRELLDKRVTNADREAAAKRAAAEGTGIAAVPTPPAQGGTPNYFGPESNWAFSPQPTLDVNGNPVAGTGIRKFVDTLPGLTVGTKDTAAYPGSDYYEIAVVQYTQKMHTDLNPTTLRTYVQIATAAVPGAHVALTYPNGQPIRDSQGNAVFAVSAPSYLGPAIVATKDRPVRVKFTNYLPLTADGGDLFIPVDTTQMGAGTGPLEANITPGNLLNYAQNRASVHLHGARTPWISDGTPHQWLTPAGEKTDYPKGVSVQNVPDMPDPGPGSMTFFYTNQQSARLMFYHDHAYGITRLNVYAGEAAPYILTDPTEQALVGGVLPAAAETIPLVIQDKTFLDTTPTVNSVGATVAKTLITDPTWPFAVSPARNDLWYPHVYMPNQDPNDLAGINAFGRWDYGPWFWPPWTVTNLPITNADGTVTPNLPDNSATMEAFHDTPLVNGKAYPTLTVAPKAYRFKILNGANDRMWNLQLYVTSNIISTINVTNGGTGYTTPPRVTITNAVGDTTGKGATAMANIDTTAGSPTLGQVVSIDLVTVGSQYTAAPTVAIAAPASGTTATATAVLYTAATEVGMVPAVSGTDNFPVAWTAATIGQPGDILDGRWGGVPDPAKIGPSFIQIGTEGGFLPAPAVIDNVPIGWDRDPKSITVGSVKEHALFLGPAERADVIVDFSQFAGQTLILYNDGSSAVPAADSRLDYYTGDLDQTDTGGSTKTVAGYGPSTRTIMQIKVSAGSNPAYNLAALQAEFATTAGHDGVFKRSQEAPIVPQAGYNSAYNATFPAGTTAYSRISSTSLTFTPIGQASPVTIQFQPKAIQELFEDTYGRMSAFLGVEIKNTNGTNQTTIDYGYTDPVTEIVSETTAGTLIGAAGDGTQIWKITHNGVDSHPIHFHLFDVQLINRVDWAGVVKPPEPNELGWKETVRMNPLEDCIVALRPIKPKAPFGVPDSVRPLDPSRPIGSTMDFKNVNPDGTPTVPPVTNQLFNFGWEYVWHCHILSHEEMDMMRPVKFNAGRSLAAAPALSGARTTGTNVNLTWTDGTLFNYTTGLPATTLGNPANEVGFKIERAISPTGAFTLIGNVQANLTAFTDPSAATNTTYQYRVTAWNAAGNSVSNIITVTGTGPPPTLTRYEQTSSQILYYANKTNLLAPTTPSTNGPTWFTFSTGSASGGSYARTTSTNASVIIPFNGTTLNIVSTKGTTLGKMDISVDGGAPVTVNLNNATTQYQQTVFSTGTLAAGMHWVQLTKNSTEIASRYISLDRLEVAGTLVAVTKNEQTNAKLLYVPNPWSTFSTGSASGGSYARTNSTTGKVTITFNGIRFDWIATMGTTVRMANVSLDNVSKGTVNLARTTTAYQQDVWTTGFLPYGVHTVVISYNNTNDATKYIDIDRADTWGALQ